jgi:hypothetical protein
VQLTTHVHLVPRIRMVELYLHSPVYFHGVALNYLSTGTTLLSYLNDYLTERRQQEAGEIIFN